MLYLGGGVSVEYDYWAPTGVRPKQYSELVAAGVGRDAEPETGEILFLKQRLVSAILEFCWNWSCRICGC